MPGIKKAIKKKAPAGAFEKSVKKSADKFKATHIGAQHLRDRNTAIALLSLGQDREALRILEALPATAISEYLRAIACSRLGRKAEGRRHFLEACRRDERMEYRAALDPEIDELLKD